MALLLVLMEFDGVLVADRRNLVVIVLAALVAVVADQLRHSGSTNPRYFPNQAEVVVGLLVVVWMRLLPWPRHLV